MRYWIRWVIFPNYVQHEDFAKKFPDWKPLSAGFITVQLSYENKIIISCYGESTSLKISAKPGDEKAFKNLI